jgi:hypothetical protein
MIEQVLKFLIAYKKELIYLAIFLIGFIAGISISPTCDRDSICEDDINAKKAAIKQLNKRQAEHIEDLRNKEDSMKKKCDKTVAKALKDNNINSSELDCLICGGILQQCIKK